MKTLITLFVLFFSSSVFSDDTRVHRAGSGVVSCQEFMMENFSKMDVLEWAIGYYSGLNTVYALNKIQPQRRIDKSYGYMMNYLNNFCEDNPNELVFYGIFNMYFEVLDKIE